MGLEIKENTGSYSYIYVLRQYGMKQLQNLVVRVRSITVTPIWEQVMKKWTTAENMSPEKSLS